MPFEWAIDEASKNSYEFDLWSEAARGFEVLRKRKLLNEMSLAIAPGVENSQIRTAEIDRLGLEYLHIIGQEPKLPNDAETEAAWAKYKKDRDEKAAAKKREREAA